MTFLRKLAAAPAAVGRVSARTRSLLWRELRSLPGRMAARALPAGETRTAARLAGPMPAFTSRVLELAARGAGAAELAPSLIFIERGPRRPPANGSLDGAPETK